MSDDETNVRLPAVQEERVSPRQKSVRQGVILMLLSVILMPAYILLAPLFSAHDRLVESSVSDTPFEKISQAILFTIFMFGLARVVYAYFFQKGARLGEEEPEAGQLETPSPRYTLSPAHSIPVSRFGAWRGDTDVTVQSSRAARPTNDLPDEE